MRNKLFNKKQLKNKSKNKFTSGLIYLCAIFMSGVVNAEESSDLSLSDILNLTVSVASKRSESINDAPGIITAVSKEEIDAFGANNLAEVLNRVTGIYVMGSYFLNPNITSIRGVGSDQYNSRTLLLLDGRPLRETYGQGFIADVLLSFPLSRISRIEIIRGPGSVLYGTGAFNGVINLVTHVGASQVTEARARYGSFNSVDGELSTGTKFGDLEVAAGARFFQTAGWDLNFTSESYLPSVSASQTTKTYQKNVSINGKVKYKGFKLDLLTDDSDLAAVEIAAIWPNIFNRIVAPQKSFDQKTNPASDYRTRLTRFFVNGSYEADLTSFWKASFDVSYNRNRARFSYASIYNVSGAADNVPFWSSAVSRQLKTESNDN